MHEGLAPDRPLTDESRESWYRGVSQCLQATHSASWRQCDVRSSNVLVVNGVVQLIDYNMAVSGETNFMVTLRQGQQYDRRGQMLANGVTGEEYTWTEAHDFDMAFRTLASL
jgi:hypothetical protein